MLDFIRKRKLDISEMNVSEKIQDTEEMREEPKTLGDLAKSGHLFFKFTKSQPGRDIDKAYTKYIPGEIVEAKDEDTYLSFVTEETIAECFMYGDMLTSLKFDINDEKFRQIADTPFKYVGGALGEYESKYLLVDNNYSLEDISTIIMLFEYVKNTKQLCTIFCYKSGFLERSLHNFQYYESENLVRYLRGEYEKNIHISPEEVRELIKKYVNEQNN